MITKNQLKMIAAVAMVIDHVGAEFFPQYVIFRIIGRIVFPIFSYFIYEGARYTHNKRNYLLRIFGLGILCCLGYYIYAGEFYGNVMITFSLSLLILFSMQYLKAAMQKSKIAVALGVVFLVVSVAFAYAVCDKVFIDYGFFGVLLPVFAELFATVFSPENITKKWVSLLGFLLGTLLLSTQMGGIQYFSILAIPLLAITSEKKGKYRMKYFFYIFYPAHLIIIGIISMLFS